MFIHVTPGPHGPVAGVRGHAHVNLRLVERGCRQATGHLLNTEHQSHIIRSGFQTQHGLPHGDPAGAGSLDVTDGDSRSSPEDA